MEPFGYQFKTVSIQHLPEIQDSVGRLVRLGLIDNQLSRKWSFYSDTNKSIPEAKSIIIFAAPQSVTRYHFLRQGVDYPAEIAPNFIFEADDRRIEEILNRVLQAAGYRYVKAHLALKTLAVRSGLARYGKNNLVYIPAIGSFCWMTAFYTDLSAEDNWQDPKIMEECKDCHLCLQNCPTGSISGERFLIHAEKCLGFLNDKNPEFPYWVKLQPEWQNAFIGCMCCQIICPLNKPYRQRVLEGQCFSEEETEQILDKIHWERLSPETRNKLGIPQRIYPLLAQNLKALMEKQRNSFRR